jgi:hypothetical protein
MSKGNKIICFFLASIFICGSFFALNREFKTKLSFGYPKLSFVLNIVLANNENVNHVVISEIKTGGENAIDEFIELFNPTNLEINLGDWDLKRKTKSGSEYSILNNIEGVIPAYGFFLIAPRANCGTNKNETCYKGAVSANDEYTTDSFLASDNAVLLYDHNGNLIDKVGWGAAVDFEGEAININPENGQSLERKITNSIVQDTDNNKNDFILQANPAPQNTGNILNNSGQNDAGQGVAENTTDDFSQDGSSQETGANGEQNGSTAFQDYGASDVNNYIPKIIITEFLPNPEDSDSDNEFIEIYNSDSVDADLAGWILEDKAGKIKKFIIPEKTILKAGKYKVFYSDETGIALNNSGDGVVLRNKNGKIISETPICDSAKEDQSYAFDKNGKWIWTLRLTPGRENIIEAEEKIVKSNNKEVQDISIKENMASDKQKGSTALRDNGASGEAYDFSDTIIISEIFPNPLGKDNQEENYEWIELHNTSDKDVNLKGWQIDDILNKGSKSYIIEEDSIIKAGGYKTFSYADTKIMLNNSSDEVNILWPDGEVIDSVKYEKTSEGQSYSLVSGEDWIWTAEITPKKENKMEAVLAGKNNAKNNFEYSYIEGEEIDDLENELGNPDFIEAEIKDLWHFEKHARVKIAGIVSAPPRIFADNVFYLNGIQIFSYEIKLPKIELGDEVEIIGRISEVGGEERILLENKKDLKVISQNNLIEPKLISTGDVNEAAEGFLVIVEGKVSQTKNEVFYLDDGSGQVKIYIKPETGIDKPEIEIGDWMVITGQASQTSLGYRILPRFKQDIKQSRVSGISTAEASSMSGESEKGDVNNSNNNSGKSSLLEFLFFMIAAVILIDWARMRKRKIKN